jgi:hypothetical protein
MFVTVATGVISSNPVSGEFACCVPPLRLADDVATCPDELVICQNSSRCIHLP